MKYIIDVPDTAGHYDNEYEMVTMRVHYGSTIVDISMDAKPYTEPDLSPLVDEAVESIENEVWEFARRIICPSDCCEDSISAHTKEIFNKEGWEVRGIFNDLSYREAKSKFEAWLKQEDKIKVGDEVIGYDVKAVVMDIDTDESIVVYTENACVERWSASHRRIKTGRHFDEVAELLEKMRGEL